MKKTKNILFYVITLLLISLIAVLKLSSINYEVVGDSMLPTLKEGDKGQANSLFIKSNIKRFKIVIVDKGDKDIIKRVIGLPNETVEYKNNKLYINNEYVEESFLSEGTITNDFKCILSDNEYFLMGDNREISLDSRSSGPYSLNDIIGVIY